MKRIRKNELRYERDNGQLRVQIDCSTGGKTDQTQRDRCNINTIMAKANMTGLLPNMERQAMAQYGDFTNSQDYQTMCTKVAQAKEEFLQLPSGIRKRFNNDPSQLIEFLNNPENRAEAIQLNLIPKPPEPPKVPIAESPIQPAPASPEPAKPA